MINYAGAALCFILSIKASEYSVFIQICMYIMGVGFILRLVSTCDTI